MKKKLYDLAERALWTGAQGATSVITVESLEAPLWAAPLIAAGLSAIKSFIAGKLGNTNTVSTLPESLDPASR